MNVCRYCGTGGVGDEDVLHEKCAPPYWEQKMKKSVTPMKSEIEELLYILAIAKGRVPGIAKSAPANKSYYLFCSHIDWDTEAESTHLTNYDEQVKQFIAKLEQMIKDAEFKARMDEHKILMANIGGEYSSAIHGLLPKTKLDTGKIGEALKQRLTELEGRK